ncbi:MAG: cation-transporting P-type ATPase [Candidatus Peribacteria bacterium]|nr:MAG: cation-transporting P-type ATPase [Candidatus Peribacteria bacterium]
MFFVALRMDLSIKEALLFAIGIAASMVPQGMPAQISVALSSAASRLAKKQALVKKLSAVETLGAVNVICTDKTGTLTQKRNDCTQDLSVR